MDCVDLSTGVLWGVPGQKGSRLAADSCAMLVHTGGDNLWTGLTLHGFSGRWPRCTGRQWGRCDVQANSCLLTGYKFLRCTLKPFRLLESQARTHGEVACHCLRACSHFTRVATTRAFRIGDLSVGVLRPAGVIQRV